MDNKEEISNEENIKKSELSKSKLKKIKKEEKWQEIKKLKKQQKKDQKKLKKTEIKEIKEIKKENENEQLVLKSKRPNKQEKQKYKEELKNSQPIIIDLSFQKLMTEKEIKSLCSQLAYCHSINRKSTLRSKLILTEYRDRIKEKLEKMSVNSWGIVLETEHYLNLFPKEKLVYLTGDAEQEMDEVEKDKIYIIGGMVDHNRLKMATYNKAKEEGIEMRKFPIGNFIKLKTSTILTVNHVFEILIRKLNNETWKDALFNTIPKRKFENESSESCKKEDSKISEESENEEKKEEI